MGTHCAGRSIDFDRSDDVINVIMQSIKINVDVKPQQRTQSTAGTYCSGFGHIFGDKPHSKVTGYFEKGKT